MTTPDHRLFVLRRAALLCVLLMLATISLSAFMRLSQAGLGCADWPACYGQALRLPPAAAALPLSAGHAVAVARLVHRVVASLALVLVVLMVLAALAARPVLRRQGGLALAMLGLALALAVLGIVTPGARLPAVAMGNLLGGFVMLALSWRLAAAARPASAATPNALGAWGVAGLALLAGQIVLGALVSASHAALACADLTDCVRTVAAGGWDWRALNPWREPAWGAGAAQVDPAGAPALLLHRLGALVVVPVLALLSAAAWRCGRRREGVLLLALTVAQPALGLALAATGLPLVLALLHNLAGALLLAMLVRLV